VIGANVQQHLHLGITCNFSSCEIYTATDSHLVT